MINRQINFATKAPNTISEASVRNKDNRIVGNSRGRPELDFKPIQSEMYTGITASRRNSKPFIIGFIPPDNPINFVPIKGIRSVVTAVDIYKQEEEDQEYMGVEGSIAAVPGLEANTDEKFQRKLIGIARKLKVNPDHLAAIMSLESAKSFNPGKWNEKRSHVGLIQFSVEFCAKHGLTRQEMSELTACQQLDYVYEYYKPRTGRLNNLGEFYLMTFYPYAMGRSDDFVLARADSTDKAPGQNKFTEKTLCTQNPGFVIGGVMTVGNIRRKIAAQLSGSEHKPRINVDPASSVPNLTETQRNPRNLMTYGHRFSLNSEDKLGGRWGRTVEYDPSREKYVKKQVDALRAQIQAIQNIPPLILLINPSQFSLSFEHTTDSSVKTRHGHIVHMWIEKPARISASGVTAGQYVVNAEGHGGLTNENRVHSLSYANLSSLIGIYKNNGRIFIGDEANSTNRGVQLLSFTVFIYYDEHLYLGSFDDFQVIDDANKPYNMSYDMKFSVRYDLAVSAKPQSLYRETDYRISRGVAAIRETGE